MSRLDRVLMHGLNVLDVNRIGFAVVRADDHHLFSGELSRFSLVIELKSHPPVGVVEHVPGATLHAADRASTGRLDSVRSCFVRARLGAQTVCDFSPEAAVGRGEDDIAEQSESR